jgi:hypothetical protein
MKLMLDNNLPPALAHALHELSCAHWEDAHQVVALRDRFPAATPDTDWITALSQEGDWTVVTHDRLNKGAEREVLKRAAIKVFLLDKSWKNQAFWAKAENLVRWWPSIVEQAERIRGGAAFRVRWKFSGKGQFDQITL